jgi:predicted permease
MAPSTLPRLDEITIDGGVLLFTAAISLGAGLLFGLVPVFKYAGQRLGTALREGGRSLSESRERRRTRSALVVVQVALALVLLISSGLMIRTLQALRHVQPGFTSPDEILTLRVTLPYAQVPKPEQVLRMEHNMADKIAAIPGVAAVGMTTSITMDGYDMHDPIYASDRTYAEQQIPPLRTYKFISPDWFRSMGNPLIAGRDFNWTDNHDMRNVVIVSENLAREMWGSPAAALQKRVRENPKAPWREVIGVVGNEYDSGVDQKPPAIVYWPLAVKDFWDQGVNVRRDVAFAVRSPRAGTAAFLDQVRQSIWSVNPEIPVADVRTVREIYDKSMARTSFTLVMLAIAAAVALLLGIVGIYGVISYSVSQRTREIGIRIALGATGASAVGLVLRDAAAMITAGMAMALPCVFALGTLVRSQLFGVTATDPATVAGATLLLGAACIASALLPAWRAAHLDPTEALRLD